MSENSKLIGHYQIIELVGEGGLGKVYKALDLRSQEIVALKMLHAHYGKDHRFLGVFHRELMMHRAVNHSSLVPILDNHFEPPNCYIVSRFIDGWPLRGLLRHFGRIPPLVAISLALQFVSGLDSLHLRDLVHGDLSTANILVEKSGRAFLTDFSLTSDTTALSQREHIFGTPGYYSPEHITRSPVVPASDIYVTGLLIFELITGLKLVPALDGAEYQKHLIQHMMQASFRAVRCTDEALMKDLMQLLRASLHPIVDKRLPNAERLGKMLEDLLKIHKISNPRMAVLQYLTDGQMQSEHKVGIIQNIYRGFHPYGLDDITLLNAL